MSARKIVRGFVFLFFALTMLASRAAGLIGAETIVTGSANLLADSFINSLQMALYPFEIVLETILKGLGILG